MVAWLHAYCPSVYPHKAIAQAATNGDVRLLKWFVPHNEGAFKLAESAGAIASTGDIEVLRWLHGYLHPDAVVCAFTSAAQGGKLDSLKYLHERYAGMAADLEGVISAAVQGGHLETAQFQYEQGFKLDVDASLRYASQNGSLEIVQWLFPMLSPPSACQRRTEMDVAAANGHLEVVQWLDANGSKGCSQSAMASAAKNGHLDIVQWLHYHRKDVKGSPIAMNAATREGHIDIVK